TGYTVVDFQMRQADNRFIHPDDRAGVASAIAAFLASDRTYSDRIENRFITRWGEVQWYSSVLAKTEYQGQLALQFVVHNITAQRRAQEESARRLRESQEAVRVRDEFLSIAAHELKTPLTSLLGYSQWVASALHKGEVVEPAKAERAVQAIERQARKLSLL